MASKNDTIPAWLPFGIVASFLVAIAAGARSSWKTAADQSATKSGALQDWAGLSRLT